MENENLEQNEVIETKPPPHNSVTPLSKYLAMLLFIALPFLGGYIGYTYAPEKIIEVERMVIKEIESTQNVEYLADTVDKPPYILTPSSDKPNWQTYRSDRFNFEISAPNNFTITENELDGVSTIVSLVSTNPEIEMYVLPNGGADYGLEGVEFTSKDTEVSGNIEIKYTTVGNTYREFIYISSSSIPTSWSNLNRIEVRGAQNELTDAVLSTFNFIE